METRALPVAEAEPVRIQITAALPYSVLLPMKLVRYMDGRSRQFQAVVREIEVAQPIAAHLITLGVAEEVPMLLPPVVDALGVDAPVVKKKPTPRKRTTKAGT